jgi:hypothetical protein
MVLILKGIDCKISLDSMFRVNALRDEVCAVSLARCWGEGDCDGDPDCYDFLCACSEVNDDMVLSVLRDVVEKAEPKPKFAIATVAPFYWPAGPWHYYDVPPKAIWVRRDAIMEFVWSRSTNIALFLFLLNKLCFSLEEDKKVKCVKYALRLLYTPQTITHELHTMYLRELAEEFSGGFLLINSVPLSDRKYYCGRFVESRGEEA